MLDPNSYETLRIERRANGVAVVWLNRPDRLNAVNAKMHTELATFSLDYAQDPQLRALVLTGQGRAFCAGGDFSADSGIGETDIGLESRQIVDHLLECPKPIVAAVNGYAMGLGANLALLCDVAVAGPGTVFADTHVKMGLGAGDGGQLIWPFLIGVNRAKYYLMSGNRVTGQEALEMGLVTFFVDDDESILSRALAVADELAAGAPKAIAASKMAINAYLKAVASMVMPLGLQYEEATKHSKDHKEAVLAFGEKRVPIFKGE